jgi:glutamate/tyrosine decarboxylase-like PLP-dependent enzyme
VSHQHPEDRERTRQLAAWFLGPKAENADWEEKMVLYILQDYFHWRRNYFPSDEILIPQNLRRESTAWNDNLFQQITEMLAGFRRHFPFYSPRYIAHMIADQTLPSILGYFAGMLYNPNNVTPEAAPVTVQWELDVGADILRMLGYHPPPRNVGPSGAKSEFGWAHVTSGGTVANLEALWLARNIRYFPLAVRDIVMREDIPLTLRLPDGAAEERHPIDSLEESACLGIKPNQAIYLYSRFIDAVRHHYGLNRSEGCEKASTLLAGSKYSISHHGTRACYASHPPALFVAGTRHYSLSKIADLLGIGRENIILVDVDAMFRADCRDLQRKISVAIDNGMFPLGVIAVAGTTEEGAVDPVHRIVELREQLERERGQSFWLHVDAAWGGYLRSLFTGEDAAKTDVNEFVSSKLTISRGRYEKTLDLRWGYQDVKSSFHAFPQAESITVDPHKLGYVPYPCGVVAFKNDLVRQFLSEEVPYISDATREDVQAHHHHPPTSLGPYILEGSKSGAAVAACWLSHRMIPPDRSGYGEILRASLLTARELYERLVHWDVACRVNGESPNFRFVPLTAMPPDTNIVCFVVVENHPRPLTRTNALNRWIYDCFTIDAEHERAQYSYSQPFFLSHTHFRPSSYPLEPMAELLERAGIPAGEYEREGLFVLRATLMSPYHVLAAETGHKQSLLAEFMEVLSNKVEEGIRRLEGRNTCC